MFVDEIIVEVTAGRGGNGLVAFRREKYVEFGGPFGGNGGQGGSVIFVGDEGKNTLLDLTYKRHIKADSGVNGKNKGMHGANAEHTYIKVPLGTIVKHVESGHLIGEVLYHDQELIVAKGGKGGRGNMAFQTNKNQAPEFAEQGEMGQKYKIKVELKVLADVGLIGYPSVGKSTILSVISNAKPKIADYPFTTLSPQLGMVHIEDDSYVVADLPGLIENAHLGVGLGIQFLRHIERCRLLLHVVSMDSEDPYQDYLNINQELISYDPHLVNRQQLLVANKMDVEGATEKLARLKEKLPNIEIIEITAYMYQNIDTLKYKILNTLKEIPKVEVFTDDEPAVIYTFKEEEKPFIITKAADGVYEVSGERLYRIFTKIDFNNDTAVRRFARQLRSLGVDDALREAGLVNGDTVRIFDFDFEYFD